MQQAVLNELGGLLINKALGKAYDQGSKMLSSSSSFRKPRSVSRSSKSKPLRSLRKRTKVNRWSKKYKKQPRKYKKQSGNKVLPSARFRINQLYPANTVCKLNVHANSSDYPQLRTTQLIQGMHYSYCTVCINQSRIIRDIQNSNIFSNVNPIDFLGAAKLAQYNQGRINYVRMSVTFTITEPSFIGVVWMMPCIYGPTVSTDEPVQAQGNYTEQEDGGPEPENEKFYEPKTNFSDPPVGWQPTFEMFKNQTIIKSKAVNTTVQPGKPVVVTLRANFRVRDLIGQTANEYSNQGPVQGGPGGWMNIDHPVEDGTRFGVIFNNPAFPQTQNRPWYRNKAYVQFGVHQQDAAIEPKVLAIQTKVHMQQYCQLRLPDRVRIGTFHRAV